MGFRAAPLAKPTRRAQPEHPNSPGRHARTVRVLGAPTPICLLAGLLLTLREKNGMGKGSDAGEERDGRRLG
mgnify:FL=1